jgi:hypothetical protein
MTAMGITLLFLVFMGATCGWLLYHWLALWFLSLAISVTVLVLAPWDLMLFPKWFGVLAVLQGSYLVGLAIRMSWDEALARRADGSPHNNSVGESSSPGRSE